MRNKVTFLNVVTSVLLQICTIASGFIIPRIILGYFGSDVNGLVSSLIKFLDYTSLLEGGITNVIAAYLYKPLIEHDQARIDSILVTARRFYRHISLGFIAYTIFLSIVYPLIFNTGFSFAYVCSLTLVLSMVLFIQYMFSMTLRTLLNADKKVFVVSVSQSVIVVLNIILGFISVKVYPSVHLLKFITGALYFVQPLVYGHYVRRHYNINWKASADNSLIKDRWSGFAINIAEFIHIGTDTVVLTVFTNMATVSIYSVYSLVANGLRKLIVGLFNSLNPTIGHAYARNDPEELNLKLDVYEYICLIVVFFVFTGIGLLITPFVLIYTRGIDDADYFQPLFGVLMAASEGLYLLKFPHVQVAFAANKFKEIKRPVYLEAVINIVVSVILVIPFGLTGVAVGTICAMTFRLIFHVYFTGKIIPGRKQIIFYRKFAVFAAASLIGVLICSYAFPISVVTIPAWILHALVYILILGAMYAAVSLLFFRKEIRFFIDYLRHR